jgi:hypothetical protein
MARRRERAVEVHAFDERVVLSTSRRLRSGSTTAASSPMPIGIHDGRGGRRLVMRAMSSRSEKSETVLTWRSRRRAFSGGQ